MNCTVAGELFGFEDDDIGVAVLPMFHVFGLSSVLNTAVRFAGTLAGVSVDHGFVRPAGLPA